MPAIGDKAPDFKLPDQDGRTVALKDLRGRKVVLFAFPRANTSGCTRQASGFRDSFADLQKAGATVLGVSPDKPETLKRWREKLGLPYDLLSDPEHRLLEAYGAWGEKKMYGKTHMGVVRSHWVIDEEGRLADVQIKVSPEDSVGRACEFLTG